MSIEWTTRQSQDSALSRLQRVRGVPFEAVHPRGVHRLHPRGRSQPPGEPRFARRIRKKINKHEIKSPRLMPPAMHTPGPSNGESQSLRGLEENQF